LPKRNSLCFGSHKDDDNCVRWQKAIERTGGWDNRGMADDTDRSNDGLRYDRMVEDALLSVVHRSLSFAAENGLPGEHHFYITFRTDHPGVQIPDQLHERYPGEMTIILQYQFWDLEVRDDDFSVTLSFSDVPEKLTIPFEAVAAFADPSVRFGLQFDVGDSTEGDEENGEAGKAEGLVGGSPAATDDHSAPGSSGKKSESQDNIVGSPANGKKAKDSAEADTKTGKSDEDSDNVVTLDTFRKK
jgi:hypothetical protein